MPRVSILLPCRNAEEHLPEAIASLAAQTFRDFEVVAVDDGSADGTFAELFTWAQHDGRVRVLRTGASARGAGLVPALATALSGARGELVARMDADDIAEPERLAKQVALLDQRPGIAACGTGVRYFPREHVRGGARRYERWLNALVEPDEIARDIFVECPIAHPTLVVRRAALLAVGGYRDLDWPEDYDLILRLWASGYRLAKVPDVLHHWRDRSTRASRTDRRYSPAAFRRCKVHFLRRTLLAGREGAVVWGAGPVGKSFARELARQGVTLRAFVDLDRRKIGQTIHGAPVITPAEIDRFRSAVALAAVGSPGAREQIRGELRQRGWKELEDFCAVA
ncbi:MAG: glycosyltransferase [Gemmatimonadetes bacterium]|nr:glycosyltransferase [Gemmatimonadota bacterium]